MHKFNTFLVSMLGTTLLLACGIVQAQTTPAASTAMPAAPAASASMAAAATPAATHKPPVVLHAQFTTAVSNRAPADDVSSLDNSHDQVFFFTVLKDAAGQTITYRWQFDGKTMAEVKLEPKADHWRTWSSKRLLPDQTGTWTVAVVDDSGTVLISKSFDYTKAPAMSPQATHKPPVMQTMQSTSTSAAAAATKAAPPPIQ